MNKPRLQIHLVTSYTTERNIGDSLYTAPPLGIISIASAVSPEIAGITCTNLMPFRDDALIKRFIETIALEAPALLGVSLNMSETRRGAYNIIEWFRAINKATPIVVGGLHASHMHCQILDNFPVDGVIVGEAEEAFAELAAAMTPGEDLPDIPGLARRDNGGASQPTPIRIVGDLGSLPFPDFSKVDMRIPISLYTKPVEKYNLGEMKLEDGLPVELSRGCPLGCVFCGVASRPYRRRPAPLVAEFIGMLQAKYGFTAFTMTDDCFTQNKEHALELCEGISCLNRPLTWAAQTRADKIDSEILTALKFAKCRLLAFGIETGSQHLQKGIKKNLNLSVAIENIRLAKEAGINTQLFFLVGHPDETKKDFADTLKFMKTANPEHACFDIVKILPGTRLADLARKRGFYEDSFWLTRANDSPLFTDGRTEKNLRAMLERLMFEWFRLKRKQPPPRVAEYVELVCAVLPEDIALKEYFLGKSGCVTLVLVAGGREVIVNFFYSKISKSGISFGLALSPADRSGMKRRFEMLLDEIMESISNKLQEAMAARAEETRNNLRDSDI